MKNILFHGYYGYKNTGDDAFIEVAAWGARKYWNNTKNKFLAQNIPVVQNQAKCLGKSCFKGHSLLQKITEIMTANAFVCAGGSTFHSQINKMNPKFIAFKKKRLLPKFKLGAIGVSLGPYKSTAAEKENIKLLRCFDFLALRDNFSYEMAKCYSLPYEPVEAFDLAALLPQVYSPLSSKKTRKQKKILGISVCNYESFLANGDIGNEKRRNKQIEDLLIKIAQVDEDMVFRFFIFNGNLTVGDKSITMNLAHKLRLIRPNNVEVIDYETETYHTWMKIKECKLVLATRLHAAIFACFANVPFFLIEYHQKCSSFLNDIGYPADYRIFDAQFETDKLVFLIHEILSDTTFMKPTRVQECILKAERNFNRIDLNSR